MAKNVSIATREPHTLPRKEKPTRQRFGLDKISLILVVLYLLVPLGATLAFGLEGGSGIDFSIFLFTGLAQWSQDARLNPSTTSGRGP